MPNSLNFCKHLRLGCLGSKVLVSMGIWKHYLLDVCNLLQHFPGTHFQLIKFALSVISLTFLTSFGLIGSEVSTALSTFSAGCTFVTFLALGRVHRRCSIRLWPHGAHHTPGAVIALGHCGLQLRPLLSTFSAFCFLDWVKQLSCDFVIVIGDSDLGSCTFASFVLEKVRLFLSQSVLVLEDGHSEILFEDDHLSRDLVF